MKKILITTRDLRIGGAETSLLAILNKIDYKKFEVDLIVKKGGSLEKYIPNKVNISYIKENNSKLYRIKKNILVKSLNKIDNNKEYDIAIAFYGFDNYVDMYAAASNTKKRIIWVHNDFLNSTNNHRFKYLYKLMYQLMARKFNYFDKIICVSNTTRDNFNKMFPKHKNKVRVIRNFVDEDRILSLAKEKTNFKGKAKLNIVSVGRLTASKNVNHLINIHKELIDKYDINTYIIGDGEERDNLQELINTLKINDSCYLLGEMSNPYNIMNKCDVLISCSLYESWGMNLLEALLLKVPFISNINSGSKDFYNNYVKEKEGIITNNDNIKNEIIKLYNDKNYLKVEHFNVNKYNEDIKKEVDQLLN